MEIETGEMKRARLIKEIQKIESQLSNRNVKNSSGRRLTPIEYHGWRTKAIHSLHAKCAELRDMKLNGC